MSAIERERLSKPSARRLRRPGKKRRRTCQRPKKKLQRKQEKSAGRRDRPRIRLREKSAGERDKSVRERQRKIVKDVDRIELIRKISVRSKTKKNAMQDKEPDSSSVKSARSRESLRGKSVKQERRLSLTTKRTSQRPSVKP